MVSLPLSLLLCFALVVSASGRHLSQSKSPSAYGPIKTNGKFYTKVCDPSRFADLGLDMAQFQYCNNSLPYGTRVRDLIGQMSLAEKVAQLGDLADGVSRIGLQNYTWWGEALHGVSNAGYATHFGPLTQGATSFATVIVSAASFNETLWKKLGQAISTEARALYNLGYSGLTFWSPTINVARDPRWGRTLETAGEDPDMVGRYAVQFVRGMQDIDGHEITEDLNTRPLKVSSCCKHYAAYDIEKSPDGIDHNRRTFDARVHEQDMVETFLRPFEMCVKEGDGSSVMCSFNKINGIPSCLDTRLLKQTIRDEWNLHGYIVSDCDALDTIYNYQHWLGYSPEEAVAATTKAGLDLDCGLWGRNYHKEHGLGAVAQGKLSERDIDNALKNQYMLLMRVGFFDNIPQLEKLGASDVCSEEHIELATESARQGIVLLKNDHNTLPLALSNGKTKKKLQLAVVGPHLNASDVMRGNYAGPPCRYTTPVQGLANENVEVVAKLGCRSLACDKKDLIPAAVDAAKKADATVIVAGLDCENFEGEERDRSTLLLPGFQPELIQRVAEASKGPVVLVVMSGGGVDVTFAQNNPKIGAILWAGYPGEEGGQAIADIVFGRYNPGGRLPLTWYKEDYTNQIHITSMQLRPNEELNYPGRTYKFYDGPSVLYPFGHGLSYTKFTYTLNSSSSAPIVAIATTLGPARRHCKHLTYKSGTNYSNGSRPDDCQSVVTTASPCKEEIVFDVQVTNTGPLAGSDSVLVYVKPPCEIEGAPLRKLVAYRKVFLPSGAAKTVRFRLNSCSALSFVERTAYTVVPAGKHIVQVGDGERAVSFPVRVKFDQAFDFESNSTNG